MQMKARLTRLERLNRAGVVEADCICFPSEEPPDLVLRAEIEAARAVLCPLHGERFSKVAANIYRASQFIGPAHLQPESCLSWRSRQYLKALRASFSSDLWPATEVADPDGSVRFVLKDGTEIHRVEPPPEVYDYHTGKPIGRLVAPD